MWKQDLFTSIPLSYTPSQLGCLTGVRLTLVCSKCTRWGPLLIAEPFYSTFYAAGRGVRETSCCATYSARGYLGVGAQRSRSTSWNWTSDDFYSYSDFKHASLIDVDSGIGSIICLKWCRIFPNAADSFRFRTLDRTFKTHGQVFRILFSQNAEPRKPLIPFGYWSSSQALSYSYILPSTPNPDFLVPIYSLMIFRSNIDKHYRYHDLTAHPRLTKIQIDGYYSDSRRRPSFDDCCLHQIVVEYKCSGGHEPNELQGLWRVWSDWRTVKKLVKNMLAHQSTICFG